MSVSVRIGGAWVAATRRVRIGGAWLPEVAAPPAPITATADFADGRAISISADDSLVQFALRQAPSSTTASRWWAVRLDNCQGKTPTIRINGYSGTNNFTAPGNLTATWQFFWTDDFDGETWHQFDNVSLAGGNANLSNNAPFAANTIWVARAPAASTGWYAARVAEWNASPLVSPTAASIDPAASGVERLRVGTLAARSNIPDAGPTETRSLPEIPLHAFQIGTGPRRVLLFAGTHPHERPSDWAFQGSVNLLLSDTADGIAARAAATWIVCPNTNAPGRRTGTTVERADDATTTNSNHNRDWPTRNLYTYPVWKAVFAACAPFDAVMDYHSEGSGPRADPGQVWAQNDGAQPAWDKSLDFNSHFAAAGIDVRPPPYTPPTGTMRRFVMDNHRATLGAHWVFEGHHGVNIAAITGWRAQGEALVRALTTGINAGLLTPPTAPAAFTAGQWSLSAGNGQATLTINALPSDGGSAITALQYRIGGGTAVTMSGTGTGARTITGLTNGVEVEVQVRAVNAVNANPDNWSDTKTVIPFAPGDWVITGDQIVSAPAAPTRPTVSGDQITG